MDKQFDFLTKSLSEGAFRRGEFRKSALRLAGILLATLVPFGALAAWGGGSKLGPLIQVSKDPDSLAGCDTGSKPAGNINFNDQCENRVAVDPSNPNHI